MMKRVLVSAIVFILFYQITFAVKPLKPKKGLLEKANLTLPIDDITARSQELFTAKKFKEITGRKPKLHERMGLKYLQVLAKKSKNNLINRDTSDIPTGCDKITFNNGKIVLGKVTEVNNTQVKYKRCDWLDGPTYTKSRFILSKINYHNGTEQMLNERIVRNEDGEIDKEAYEKSVKTGGIFLVGFLSFLIISILGLLIGIAIPKGPKRRAFYFGWLLGFLLSIVYVLILLSQFR